ncbi:hypothetical protein BpHYR1_029095 [Brachionus plicatilis]|uniref:Uncharacterized protein n=1 Tax=Brachionus plicatilis TaxID=10195 RepID=A0A3M7Q4J6_BRAPC|nr:hypothetical protein BpHYR1_029095 [Brachionus plicatilis]
MYFQNWREINILGFFIHKFGLLYCMKRIDFVNNEIIPSKKSLNKISRIKIKHSYYLRLIFLTLKKKFKYFHSFKMSIYRHNSNKI